MNLWRFLMLVVPLVVALAPVGCTSKGQEVEDVEGVRLKGVIQRNGRDYRPSPNETLRVIFFVPGDEEKTEYHAEVNPSDSTFAFGPEVGQPLPPGKYRIAVLCSSDDGEGRDRFKGTYSRDNTPLEYEVTSAAEQTVTLDVGTKKVIQQ